VHCHPSREAGPTPATWDPRSRKPVCRARRSIRRRRLLDGRPIPILANQVSPPRHTLLLPRRGAHRLHRRPPGLFRAAPDGPPRAPPRARFRCISPSPAFRQPCRSLPCHPCRGRGFFHLRPKRLAPSPHRLRPSASLPSRFRRPGHPPPRHRPVHPLHR
jgi:hypothetical protein